MNGDTAKQSETYADEGLAQTHMAELLEADAFSMRGLWSLRRSVLQLCSSVSPIEIIFSCGILREPQTESS
jgi:hypothetical protein